MNHTRKKIALLIGALIIGQAVSMQNMQGMDIFGTENTQENATMTWNFWSNALYSLYNSISNNMGHAMHKVSMWNEEKKPIAGITKGTIQLASWSKPVTVPVILSYGAYTCFPSYISYPLLAWGWNKKIKSLLPVRQENIDRENPAREGLFSNVFAQMKEGVQEAGINQETIQNGITAIKSLIDPIETAKQGYQTTKNALGTIKNDVINTAKQEISDDIRYALNIPANQPVNFDTVTDKLTGKLKNEVREAKNAIKDEMREAKDAYKAELEHDLRAMLDMPAGQPVNATTIAKKMVEEPVRKIFNIEPNKEVTADAVMYNVAKNTVYRFGIPTAALVAATPIAITAGYFGCKYAYYRLTTEPEPPIFIESSEKSRWQILKDFVLRNTDEIPELAYSEELEKTFDLITRSSINAFFEIQEGNKKIFYEPILIYGLPGTGKTAKAKQMIKQIYQATNGKMQWRITNGSMLLKAGQHGINKMFDWLNKQPAACLFIDEADTLFPDRDEMEKYPERLETINHLLSLIGERSNKYMIIMTTNRLGAFDEAMARRIDNLIHIQLPNEQGRNRVLKLYRDNMLLNQKSKSAVALDESTRQHLTDAKIAEIARTTNGLSNGDLQGIINKIKTYASITEDGRVTQEIVDLAVKEYVDKHNAFKDAHSKKKAQ